MLLVSRMSGRVRLAHVGEENIWCMGEKKRLFKMHKKTVKLLFCV